MASVQRCTPGVNPIRVPSHDLQTMNLAAQLDALVQQYVGANVKIACYCESEIELNQNTPLRACPGRSLNGVGRESAEGLCKEQYTPCEAVHKA